MDKHIKELFNCGNNDGNTSIICCDEKIVKCHSFVIKQQTDQEKTILKFSENENIFKLNYESYLVIQLLGKMYDSNFKLVWSTTPEKIIVMFEMMEQFAMKDKEQIKKELAGIFYDGIKRTNWYRLLDKIFGQNLFKELQEEISKYFTENILYDNLKDNDPFDGIDMNSPIGKYLLYLLRLEFDAVS